MPAGGSVVSSTGLYACAAVETCELVVDHPYFKESFTAEPAEGYRFSHWQDTDRGFCRSSVAPVCDEIDTGLFLAHRQLIDWLAVDITYYLTPVFIAESSQAPANDPLWHINSNHHAIHYEVDGSTPEEILEALNGDANPQHISPASGSKPIATARPRSLWNYSVKSDASGELCEVAAGIIDVTYTTTVPQLLNPADKPAELQSGWAAFQNDVFQHEAGHQKVNRFFHQQLPALFAAVGEVRCEELSTVINQVYKDWSLDIAAGHEAYHADVGSSTSFWNYF